MYSRFYRRCFLIATVVILGYVLLQFLQPFWAPLGWAAILAFLLHPLNGWLTRKLKGRRGRAAAILTGLTPFLIIAPLASFALIFAQQVAALLDYLRERDVTTSWPDLLNRLENLPLLGRIVSWLGPDVSITAEQIGNWLVSGLQAMLKSAAALSGTFALGVVGTLVGFFLMLFLLFFLLRDGESMLGHMMRLIPMEPAQRLKLRDYLSDVTRAVVFGHALTAVIQGTLVGIGFAIAGLPSPVVFGVFGAIAAFIPAAGTGFVLIPAVLYLLISQQWGWAIFMALWTAGVGTSDNLLRPYLTRQRAQVSTLTVFVGVIGGVSTFGFIGSLIGPVVLALIVALLRFAEEHVLKPAEPG
ncbi:MAG: AI-2E family transporter [Steroidobacteraceae bacterium]|nr:AI-2E family transporter [Steroidobacteraceae bacterium]